MAQQTWNNGDPLSEIRTKIQANDTDLYANKADKENTAFVAGALTDLKILTTAEPVDGEPIISATPSDKTKQTYTADTVDTLIAAVSGAGVTVQAGDPTEASATGLYAATGSGDFFIKTDLGLFAIAGAYTADPIIPTLTSATVSGAAGDVLTLVFSTPVTQGSGWNIADLTLSFTTAGAITPTYSSGNNTNTHIFSITPAVFSDDTAGLLQWAGTANGLESSTGNDLAQITDGAVANNSTLSGSSYLFEETFEATGYDNAGWTTSGTVDPDYITTPIAGSQSISIAYGAYALSPAISGISGGVEFDFLVKFTSDTNTVDCSFFKISSSTAATLVELVLRAAGSIRAYHGSVFTTGGAYVAGTTYHIWVDYTPGTGANGALSVFTAEYTGSEVKPGAPTLTAITTGTATAEADNCAVRNLSSDPGGFILFDNVRVAGM